MKLSIIVAMNKDWVIGKDGKIPWHYAEDMCWFKEKTEGSTVIMGRKTWESMGKKSLSNRNTIIVSKTLGPPTYSINHDGKVTAIVYSVDGAIGFMHFLNLQSGWFIGGYKIYQEALWKASDLWITEVPDVVHGDNLTYFPVITDDWQLCKYLDYEELPAMIDSRLRVAHYHRQNNKYL